MKNVLTSSKHVAPNSVSHATPVLMSRLSSGLPIFGLSDNARTLARLSLCRGVIPLYFDAKSFETERVEGAAIEFLRDNGYISNGDELLLTRGEVMGKAGSTNILKILPVR